MGAGDGAGREVRIGRKGGNGETHTGTHRQSRPPSLPPSLPPSFPPLLPVHAQLQIVPVLVVQGPTWHPSQGGQDLCLPGFQPAGLHGGVHEAILPGRPPNVEKDVDPFALAKGGREGGREGGYGRTGNTSVGSGFGKTNVRQGQRRKKQDAGVGFRGEGGKEGGSEDEGGGSTVSTRAGPYCQVPLGRLVPTPSPMEVFSG